MSKKAHIKKSRYNDGKFAIDHILPNEVLLSNLEGARGEIKDALFEFKKIDTEFLFKVNPNGEFVNAWDYIDYDYERRQTFITKISEVFDNTVFSHSTLEKFEKSWTLMQERKRTSGRPKDRIAAINEELRSLKQDLKKNFSVELFQQATKLVKELHSIISFCFTKQERYVRRLKINYDGGIVRDIRRRFRRTLHIIFKNLPDFSGCEEEEARVKNIFNTNLVFLIHNTKSHVRYNVFTDNNRYFNRVGARQME